MDSDLLMGALMPHPPLLMPDIGKEDLGEVCRTEKAMKELSGEILSLGPELPSGMEKQAGCFVSIKRHGILRGCIGTVDPMTGCLAEEIIRNAIEAGTEDDRFFPVEADELEELTYTVDVLSPEERVCERSQLNPEKYGLIVMKGERNALLLPNLEGVETVEDQILLTKEKAGIAPDDEDVEYYRFAVERHV